MSDTVNLGLLGATLLASLGAAPMSRQKRSQLYRHRIPKVKFREEGRMSFGGDRRNVVTKAKPKDFLVQRNIAPSR